MSEELDFELVDDSVDGQEEVTVESDEETTSSDDKSEKGSEDNTTSAKSNKSNFKKISKLNKALLAENKKLKAKMAQKAKAEESQDDFEDLEEDGAEGFDKTEFRFFVLENPEAKEFAQDIEEIMDEYPNMDFKDALALAKAKKPTESKDSDDFTTKSVNTKVRKRLGDLTQEEALKLPTKQYLEYQRLKGYIK